MQPHVVNGQATPSATFGPAQVTALLPDGGPVSVVLVTVRGSNAPVRNTRSHTYYFVMAGSGRFELDGTTYDVARGDLVVIPPGVAYQDSGELELLAVCSPPFDLQFVEAVDVEAD